MRLRLIALAVAFIVTPALAQVMRAQPIQRPLAVPQIQPIQQEAAPVEKVMTIEEAKARISQLLREKRELNDKLTETVATLDQWTKKGGSLVHAYCESDTISRRTDGAGQEDCAHNGYLCNGVDGMCRKSCNDSAQCSANYTCHMPGNYCEYTGGGVTPS